MLKNAGVVFGKLLLLSMVLQLAIFYFKLGWFVLYIWLGGGFLALQLTKWAWGNSSRKFVSIILVLGSYGLASFLVWNSFFNWKSERIFTMVWEDKGVANEWREAEIVLQFADYPQHYIGIYSNDLAAYLKSNRATAVQVTFAVTSDLGCMRGFHQQQIGALSKWQAAGGYAGVSGKTAEPSPWGSRPWWCP